MKLSQTAVYAIKVTLLLARTEPGVPIPSSQLARAGRMPKRYLLAILQRLAANDVLHATRGVMGGYFLSRPARNITLLDIVEACDELEDSKASPLRRLEANTRQRLAKTLENVSRAANAELQKVTVADLVRGQSRRGRRR
jgi:Rrf2 family protein